MSTITATIFVGTAHPYDGGIQPTHMIQVSEGNRIALHLHRFGTDPYVRTFTEPVVGERITIIPTVDHIVDDVFLMISTYILGKVKPLFPLHGPDKKSLTDLFSDDELQSLYRQSKASMESLNMKVVFHLLDESHLLTKIDQIEAYPCEFEITTSLKKRERSAWADSEHHNQVQKQ
jgi:hypothetical protein